jgi:hypothetical protein
VVKPVIRTNLMYFNSPTIKENYYEYREEKGKLMAQIIDKFISVNLINSQQYAMLQTNNLKQGLHRYGQKGKEAALEEIRQLHERTVFIPINVSTMTIKEKEQAMESMIFLVEKEDKRLKARACANGSIQQKFINKEEASSPTVATESILLTRIIEAKEM